MSSWRLAPDPRTTLKYRGPSVVMPKALIWLFAALEHVFPMFLDFVLLLLILQVEDEDGDDDDEAEE